MHYTFPANLFRGNPLPTKFYNTLSEKNVFHLLNFEVEHLVMFNVALLEQLVLEAV